MIRLAGWRRTLRLPTGWVPTAILSAMAAVLALMMR